MSRAFVKEDVGERWTPPAPAHEYKIVLDDETLHETDDLLSALNWVSQRQRGGFEVRSKEGRLLAKS